MKISRDRFQEKIFYTAETGADTSNIGGKKFDVDW